MADIIALPCAANERVVQMPRRGPLPARYPYLPRIRRDRRLAQYQEERRQAAEHDRAAKERAQRMATTDAQVLLRLATATGEWDARVLGGPDWDAVLPALTDLVAKLEEEAGIARRAPVLALTPRQAVGGGAQ